MTCIVVAVAPLGKKPASSRQNTGPPDDGTFQAITAMFLKDIFGKKKREPCKLNGQNHWETKPNKKIDANDRKEEQNSR